MAWIDDFMSSNLHTEINALLSGGHGISNQVVVLSSAITLACKTAPPTQEQDTVDGILAICAATGWIGRIFWIDQKVVFSK